MDVEKIKIHKQMSDKEIKKVKLSYDKYFSSYIELLKSHDKGEITNAEFNNLLIDISKKQSDKQFHKW